MRGRCTFVPMLVAMAAATAVLMATPAFGVSVPVEKGAASAEIFAPANTCSCHGQFQREWAQSMHAKALVDPVYRTKVAEADAATDGQLGAFCDSCHGPVATMGGEIGSSAMSPASDDAIGCSFCHHLTGNSGDPGNTSQLVATDGVRRAQIKDPQAPHPAAYEEFQTKAELCGGCHNVNHPVNGMHLESTYSEWKKGPYAAQGVQCQDCHMSEAPGTIGPSTGFAATGGVERDNIYRMSFVGAQVALGNPKLATARLKSAATIGVDGPDVVEPGSEASMTITVTNSGAGHYLPTGLTEIRQMWLEIYAEDASGERTKIGERIFGTILADAKGNSPAELWEATKIESDDRIPPKKSITESVTFTMPDDAEQGSVSAALYYKSVPDELAKKAGVKNPTTQMAEGTLDVYATQALKAAADAKTAAETPAPASQQPTSPRSNTLWIAIGMAAVVAIGAGALVFARSRRS